MNMYQWLSDVKAAKNKQSMPVLSYPSIQLLGITVRQLLSDSDLQSKGMKAVADRVPSLASVSLMDLSVEAEAFGAAVRFSDDEVPTVTGAMVSSQKDADALVVPSVGTGRTGIYVDSIRKALKLITDRPVFAGVIGPFSLSGRLVDVNSAMIYCYEEPELLHTVLQKATDFLISYLLSYREAGAHGVVMAEPLTGLLSPDLAHEFSEPYVKKIVDAVQTEEFLVIYHNCGGATVRMTDSILATGCKAFHFGNAIRMQEMLAKMPSDVVVMGNIDPVSQFRNGTPESIRKAVFELLTDCSQYPNYLISSGCDIPPLTPWANIDAYFAAVGEFYAK